jgi:hypothetical protein
MRAAQEKAEAEAANNPPPPDPEIFKVTTQAEVAKMQADSAERIEELRYQTAMMTLAESRNIELDKLRTMFAVKSREIDSKERITAVEAAVTEAHGPTGGGLF